ncbi:hypothetical protein Taro_032181, partial [Colocasia esculenta]|nr:hypothetical protein [Colocasia esculenta]
REMSRGQKAVGRGGERAKLLGYARIQMPQLAPRTITRENISDVDRGFSIYAQGPLEDYAPREGAVDLRLVSKQDGMYCFDRDRDYPREFPLDEHLFPFIHQFTSPDPDIDASTLASEKVQLERAILAERDSMMGTCAFTYPSFPSDYPYSIQFPDISQLGFFSSVADSLVKTSMMTSISWDAQGQHKLGPSFSGLSLLPSDARYVSEGYSQFCFLSQIMSGSTPSWYDGWSVIPSHRFRLGATEWLMGVLHHYCDLLDQNSFASDTTSWSDYYQLPVDFDDSSRLLAAPHNKGWNPRGLPDRTYLAAYLVYWLSSFDVPYGEDGYIRPKVIHPACALADEWKLALAPAALANIFHGLGNLTEFPRVDASLHGLQKRGEKVEKPLLYTGAMQPLERLVVPGPKKKPDSAPTKTYSWWLHFLSDCGYPTNADLSSPILSDGFNNELWSHWEEHLRHSIARVGPIEFITKIENCHCHCLGDLWDAVSQAGRVVRLEPEKVVLPPGFSPFRMVPNYIIKPTKKKQSSPRSKKRRAVKAGGVSKRVAREHTFEAPPTKEHAPSTAAIENVDLGVQNKEGANDMEADDYNPISDGVPSSDEGGVSTTAGLGRGGVEMGSSIAQPPTESHDQDDPSLYDGHMFTSFQEIQNLLNSKTESALPDYQEVATTSTDGTVTISSVAEVPGLSTLEEGELPREIISGEGGLASLDPACPVEGIVSGDPEITPHDRLGGELTGVTEHNPPVINTPSQGQEIEEGPTIGEDSDGLGGTITGDVPTMEGMVMSSPTPRVGADVETSGATRSATDQVDGSTIIEAISHCDASIHSASQDAAPPVLEEWEANTGQRLGFPPHGIVWPDGPQASSQRGMEFLIEQFVWSIRTVVEAEFPPSIDKVRDHMETSTRTYHLMGLPREPWMAVIDSMWEEVRRLYEKSAWETICLQIRQLRDVISALEGQITGACAEVEALKAKRAELASSSAAYMDEMRLLEQAIDRALTRLKELKPALTAAADSEKKAMARMEVIDQRALTLEHELAAKKSMVMDLERQRPPFL